MQARRGKPVALTVFINDAIDGGAIIGSEDRDRCFIGFDDGPRERGCGSGADARSARTLRARARRLLGEQK
jgi:hypothetical protein